MMGLLQCPGNPAVIHADRLPKDKPMPNLKNAFNNNTPGAWYVDDQCICCGLCGNVAPELFQMSPDGGNFLVYRQPATPQELDDAENARERCPAEAIGSDRPAAVV